MPFCPQCPGRFFKDAQAIQMHTESKRHSTFDCRHCDRTFTTENGRSNHEEAKHTSQFECEYCDREFATDQSRLAHQMTKHPPTYECHHCDREFNSEEAREQHEDAKHPPTFECRHCDREFNSEGAREQHENVKHPPTFECCYCSSEFSSEEAREQHEDARHLFECRHCDWVFHYEEARKQHEDINHPSTFECRHCDREFSSEGAREQHEAAKHPSSFECRYCDGRFSSEEARRHHEDASHTFECRYCVGEFHSEEARELHEDSKHPPRFECYYCPRRFSSEEALQQHERVTHFECDVCGKHFTTAEALRQHEQTSCIQCSYCSMKFATQSSKNAHEKTSFCNPANRVKPTHSLAPSNPPLRTGLLVANDSNSTEIVVEEMLASPIPQRTYGGSESPAPPSPSHSSDSAMNEEMFHSTKEIFPASARGGDATIKQSCLCSRSLEPGICSICQQTSPASSNTDKPAPDDAGKVVAADDTRKTMFICTPCFEMFETREEFQNHDCSVLAAMVRPHCPICYFPFGSLGLLEEHMEGARAFTCQLCQIPCCSTEMMQDHLLGHPTCSKCSKSFADSLALCMHVDSDHPVVVCWDCDGVVVEKDNLELHYADSAAHPSCVICGVGKRSSVDMDEHVKDVHGSRVEMEDRREGGNNVDTVFQEEDPLADDQSAGNRESEAIQEPSEKVDRTPSPSAVEIIDTLCDREPDDGLHNSSVHMESSLALSPQLPQVEHVDEAAADATNEEETGDDLSRYATPSPTPSEHGSDESRLQLPVSEAIHAHDDAGPPSPATSVSAEPFSDLSTQSSPSPSSSSSQSVVFVSADGIPDYIRDNRAVLVATSASSHVWDGTRLFPLASESESSPSSLASLNVPAPNMNATQRHQSGAREAPTSSQGSGVTHRLHCRICLRDPCEEMTATMCGHIFCKRCITQAVVARSECPVCKNATLLYCLFRLDLSV